MIHITFEQLPEAVSKLYAKLEDIERLLQQKAELLPEQDQLLSIKQAAEFLKLSVPTLYSLVSKSQIPVNKRSKRLYFSKQELTAWIKAGRKSTTSEIENTVNDYLKRNG